MPELKELAPDRRRGGWAPIRMPTVDVLKKALRLPDFRDYGVKVDKPGHRSRPRNCVRWATSCAT